MPTSIPTEFYGSIAAHYDDIFPLRRAQLGFVSERLPAGAAVLDVGCSTGALAAALAARGHHTVGVDLDPEMIARAATRAAAEGADARFRVADMTALTGDFPAGAFDAVICLGNTLVHLPDPETMGRFVADARTLLRPGGVLVTQTINYDRLLGEQGTDGGASGLPTIENDIVRFERRYAGLAQRTPFAFDTTLMVKASGQLLHNSVTLYPLVAAELSALLADAGFSDVQRFGSFASDTWTPGSYPLITVSRRR